VNLPYYSRRMAAVAAIAVAGMMTAAAPLSANASTTLKTMSASDKTATIGLPSGWTLTKGLNGFIGVTGPNGEVVSLGVIVIAKNAATGGQTTGEVAFTMPYGSTLKDKFTMILQSSAKKAGAPVPQITIASQTQTKLPMCALMMGGWTVNGTARKFEAVVCSLQPDILGLYKNLVFMAQVPATIAAQDRPLVEQIVQSYRVTPDMFKKMLASYTPLPPASAMHASMPAIAPYEDPTNSDCFDYNVIRESPPWEVPMHCGGTMPG
jgi:hypothetical protein